MKNLKLYSQLSDRELLPMLHKDRQAFDALYERYNKLIWTSITSLLPQGKKDDVMELVNDVWVNIYEKSEHLRPKEGTDFIAGYIITVIKGKVCDYYREVYNNKCTSIETSIEAQMTASLYDTNNIMEKEEFWNRIHKVIRRYPEVVWKSFYLKNIEDLSNDKIVEILGIAPQTIKNNSTTVINALRLELGDLIACILLGLSASQWTEYMLH